MKKLNQSGSHLLALILAIAGIGIIGLAAARVLRTKQSTIIGSPSATSATVKAEEVVWSFDDKKLQWAPKSGTAPACEQPFTFTQTPIDLTHVTAIGMPGMYRGFSYKPHGGFRLADATNGQVDIVLPIDATLTGIKRYYEGQPAELQYLLNFETACGIAFRLDHLYTLTPAFQKIAETTPEPKINDTRSDPNIPFTRTKFKAGDVVATAVGSPGIRNFGFDFGVYDYRQRNEISKNPAWTAIHNTYQDTEWYGVCWLTLMPKEDQATALELANTVVNPAQPTRNQTSDYCPNAKYKTLEFNNGQPTEG